MSSILSCVIKAQIAYWHVAQLVERLTVNQNVAGSNPVLPVKLTAITKTGGCRKRYRVRIKLYKGSDKNNLGIAVTLRLLYCQHGVMVSQRLAKPSNRNVVQVQILLLAFRIQVKWK